MVDSVMGSKYNGMNKGWETFIGMIYNNFMKPFEAAAKPSVVSPLLIGG